MQLTDEQIKIRAFGEEMKQAREPKQTAQEIIDLPALTDEEEIMNQDLIWDNYVLNEIRTHPLKVWSN